ncbi:diguanylate cyclase [Pseudaeromonas paramecii]|uniref:diguanylate cyclase n=1 Tax=Pseudaeromonas paramecii TaxID=2138166 RepID=A0ABP8QIH8_9GAMM
MSQIALDEFHWILDVLQSIDVGLVVVDRQFNIQLWNGFMENHSGIGFSKLQGQGLFHRFPALPESWLRRKVETVLALNSPTFTSWEQRPRLFNFISSKPFTGRSELMYQNITILPLTSRNGTTDHACIILYDVTDAAMGKLGLQEANQQLKVLSVTDRLTGLFNRGHWEECLRQEFNRCQRHAHSSTLMMFDIDFFKKINDGYGHLAGDAVLRRVSKTLMQVLRSTDVAGRYGGEEFGILLLDVDEPGAMYVAERLRIAMAEQIVEFDQHHICFSISVGIARLEPQHATASDWIAAADAALYHAKRNGRNCCVLASRLPGLLSEAKPLPAQVDHA